MFLQYLEYSLNMIQVATARVRMVQAVKVVEGTWKFNKDQLLSMSSLVEIVSATSVFVVGGV